MLSSALRARAANTATNLRKDLHLRLPRGPSSLRATVLTSKGFTLIYQPALPQQAADRCFRTEITPRNTATPLALEPLYFGQPDRKHNIRTGYVGARSRISHVSAKRVFTGSPRTRLAIAIIIV